MNNINKEQTIFNDEISNMSAWGLFKTLLGSVVRSSVRATSSVEAGFMAIETTIGLAQNEIDALAAEQVLRLKRQQTKSTPTPYGESTL